VQAYSFPAPVISGAGPGPIHVTCVSAGAGGIVTFRGLVFDSCDNGCIAVLSANQCDVVVENCVFQNSISAIASPLSVGATAAAVNVTSSTFVDNVVIDASGGISVAGATMPVTIRKSRFLRNVARHFNQNNTGGGALSYQLSGAISILTVDMCVFQDNSAQSDVEASFRGGAVYADAVSSDVDISSSLFHNNTSGSDGGAIAVLNAKAIGIAHSLFEFNSAQGSGSFRVTGGAVAWLCVVSSCSASFATSTARNNLVTAPLGAFGGALAYGATTTLSPRLTSSYFFGNTASNIQSGIAQGGAIFGGMMAGPTLNCSATVFCQNANMIGLGSSFDDVVVVGPLLTSHFAPSVGILECCLRVF
jgi:predicted outer membrane repeat protein